MFKIYVIYVIFCLISLLQFTPYVFIDQLEDDLQWQWWHLSMLGIVVLQQSLIFHLLYPNKWRYAKSISLGLLFTSVYFLLEYIFSTFTINIKTPVEEALKLYNEIINGRLE